LNHQRLDLSLLSATEDGEKGHRAEDSHGEVAVVVAYLETKRL
jgi:hypothetical protein